MSKAIDFNGSTLLMSIRSPFARRVRLALIENKISYEERLVDVFNPNEELIKNNPLARVPTLILKSGQTLIDSNLILKVLYETVQDPLTTASPEDRLCAYQWSAIAYGLCEKLVEYYLETLRPEDKQDPEVFAESKSIFKRTLLTFESFIADQPYIATGGLTQADLDMGTALTYLSLRGPEQWASKYPNTARYLTRISERPSFVRTSPTAPN